MILKKFRIVRRNFYLLNIQSAGIYARIKNKLIRGFRSGLLFFNGTNKLEVTSPGMEWAYYYKNVVMPNFGRSIFDRNSYILLINGSFGDVFPNLALLKAFYEKYESNIEVLISTRWIELTERFNYPFVKYVLLENENLFRYTLMLRQASFALVKGYPYPLLPTLHPHMGEAVLSQRISDYEIKKLILGLPKGCKMDLPKLETERLANLKKIFSDLECTPGKTLIISLKRNSMPPIPKSTRVKIINFFEINSDLDIMVNDAETFDRIGFDTEGLTRAKIIRIPCDCPIEMVNYAGLHLGISSGLGVILGTFPVQAKLAYLVDTTKTTVLNNNFETDSYAFNSVLNSCKDEIVKSNIIKEFIYTEDGIEKALEQVLQWVK